MGSRLIKAVFFLDLVYISHSFFRTLLSSFSEMPKCFIENTRRGDLVISRVRGLLSLSIEINAPETWLKLCEMRCFWNWLFVSPISDMIRIICLNQEPITRQLKSVAPGAISELSVEGNYARRVEIIFSSKAGILSLDSNRLYSSLSRTCTD